LPGESELKLKPYRIARTCTIIRVTSLIAHYPMDEELNTLQALGFTLPTPAYIFGAIVFGIIGFVAYRYGKKTSHQYVKWIGVALMLYPYIVPETWLMYAVGIALCAACYYYRDR